MVDVGMQAIVATSRSTVYVPVRHRHKINLSGLKLAFAKFSISTLLVLAGLFCSCANSFQVTLAWVNSWQYFNLLLRDDLCRMSRYKIDLQSIVFKMQAVYRMRLFLQGKGMLVYLSQYLSTIVCTILYRQIARCVPASVSATADKYR